MDIEEAAEYSLKAVIKVIQTYFRKAQEYSEMDAKRCQAYLEVARTAVNYLMKKPEEILQEARKINLNHPDEVKKLRDNLTEYLFTNDIRRNLHIVTGALRKTCHALDHHADRFILPKGVKGNRKRAISNYLGLLEKLETNLEKLKGNLEQRKKGYTGLGANGLLYMSELLKSKKPTDVLRKEFDNAIDTAAAELAADTNDWLQLLEEISGTIEDLATAFGRII